MLNRCWTQVWKLRLRAGRILGWFISLCLSPETHTAWNPKSVPLGVWTWMGHCFLSCSSAALASPRKMRNGDGTEIPGFLRSLPDTNYFSK